MKLRRITALFLAITTMVSAVCVFADKADEYINLALLKPCSASGYSEEKYAADKANDGINDNADYSAWVANADGDVWWSVDLLLSYRIDYVEVEPRIGYSGENICDDLRIIAANDDSFHTYRVLCEDGAVKQRDGSYRMQSRNYSKFRYVRLEWSTAKAVEIGEIRLLADPKTVHSNDAEVAAEKTAEDRFVMPSDVTDTDMRQIVSAMNGLGVMRPYTDDTFGVYNMVTRGELCRYICRFAGLSDSLCVFEDCGYSDIGEEIENSGYVSTAYSRGFLRCLEGKYFRPKEEASVEDVLIMIMNALGYQEMIKEIGINASAVSVGLRRGKDVSLDDSITRSELARLLYSALDIKMMGKYADGSVRNTGVTALYEYHSAYKSKGVAVADNKLQLSPFINNVRGGEVCIDSTYLLTNGLSVNPYIGMSVEYFCREESGNRVLLSIVPTSSNKSVRIDAKNIKGYSNNRLTYLGDRDNEKSITIPRDAYIVYNGKVQPDEGRNHFNPENGYLLLLDHNGDNHIDTVFIYEAEIVLVNWVDVKNGYIYLKDLTVPLKTNEEGIACTILLENEEITVAELQPYDVLYVYKNDFDMTDRRLICQVYRNRMKAALQACSDNYLTLKGKTYEYIAKNIDASELTFFDVYMVYFGENDLIVSLEETGDGKMKYGYLQKVGLNDARETVIFRIFTQSGLFADYASSNRMTIDGEYYKKYEDIARSVKEYHSFNGKIDGLIKYITNEDDKVVYLDTVRQGANEDKTALSLDYVCDNKYYKNTGVVGGMYNVSNAVIFQVPEKVEKERGYAVLSTSVFSHNAQYTFDGYDANDKRELGALLMSGGSASLESDVSLMLVDHTLMTVDEDGEILPAIEGIRNGETITLKIPEEIQAQYTFVPGDILRVGYNSYNELTGVRKLYTQEPSSDKTIISPSNSQINTLYNGFHIGCGKVIMKSGNYFSVAMAGDVGDTTYMGSFTESGVKIYLYDSERQKAEIASPDEIVDAGTVGEANADTVLFCTSGADLREVIIIR